MKKRIYFIPGTMCDTRLWNKLYRKLQKNYELIHIPIPQEDNINNILNSLKRVLPEEEIHLIGFSLGGYLVSAFMAEFPERVKKLLVISNSPCKLPDEEILERAKLIEQAKKFGYSGITKQKANRLLHHSNKNNEEIIKTIIEMDKDLGESTLLNQLTATTKRKNLSKKLLKVNKPILFCFGDEDILVNKDFLEQLPLKNTPIEVRTIKNCGHMLPLEQPMMLAATIIKWAEL